MDIETNRQWLLERLKQSVNNTGVRLPAGIKFQVDNKEEAISMHLARDSKGALCVTANMQTDPAAFEGWALVIRAHIPGINSVRLTWDVPSDRNDRHYQRFLYRVDRFSKAFQEWFVCTQPDKEYSKIRDGQAKGYYKLNVPTKDRTGIPPSVSPGSERWLERMLVGALRDKFMEKAGIKVLGNQLPVGVFDGEVATPMAVFTGKASAIDLWGINADGDELSLFELKKSGNAKVGALTELFFYAMVMKDVVDGRFAFTNKRQAVVQPWPAEHITGKIRRIKAYLMVDEPHCLVTPQVLDIMDKTLAPQGISVKRLWLDELETKK